MSVTSPKSGFSLIELMVVIAIVALLAAVAVPSYQSYVARSKMVSALNVLDSVRLSALDYYNRNVGAWPTTLAQMNLTSSSFNSTLISSLGICGTGCAGAGSYGGNFGVYVILNTAALPAWTGGATPTLEMNAVSGDPVIWYCTTDTTAFSSANHIPSAYLPGGCINPGGI